MASVRGPSGGCGRRLPLRLVQVGPRADNAFGAVHPTARSRSRHRRASERARTTIPKPARHAWGRMDGAKWGWALILVCPTCAGSFILAVAAALGVGAALLKSLALGLVVVLLASLWAANAWRRRGECHLPS